MSKQFTCQFVPGQVVQHRHYGYRGVIYDVDQSCQADDDWYYSNKTQPDRNQPWYHLLVDGEYHTTYVAEENLSLEQEPDPIDHPLVLRVFSTFKNGQYHRPFHA